MEYLPNHHHKLDKTYRKITASVPNSRFEKDKKRSPENQVNYQIIISLEKKTVIISKISRRTKKETILIKHLMKIVFK